MVTILDIADTIEPDREEYSYTGVGIAPENNGGVVICACALIGVENLLTQAVGYSGPKVMPLYRDISYEYWTGLRVLGSDSPSATTCLPERMEA
jgi:hypothetical protein